MRIKKLEICGFKSFVDRTILTFPDPITAVVGPNGCGKSNIVDAIRWVMGEQSAKHLRGRAMDDVIFAGSDGRGPAGLAEVSLTFDARAMPGDAEAGGVAWGAAGPDEVVVTRRLYRAGDSEYLLGGVPCRLRDIVEFFLGTGVGSKAYAIIEQGRIGFIVSSRPEDRRTLIDEAAGITKYKAKKKLAERRMESTRQHLLRVSDIITEIETRLRSLRLQAQKAERYKRYKGELKDLELWSSAQRYLGFLAEEKSLLEQKTGVEEQHQREASTLATDEVTVEAERLAVTEEMTELAAAKDELFALSNKAQLGGQRASTTRMRPRPWFTGRPWAAASWRTWPSRRPRTSAPSRSWRASCSRWRPRPSAAGLPGAGAGARRGAQRPGRRAPGSGGVGGRRGVGPHPAGPPGLGDPGRRGARRGPGPAGGGPGRGDRHADHRARAERAWRRPAWSRSSRPSRPTATR